MRWPASAPRPPESTLACPGCGAHYHANARFCDRCRLPLVLDRAHEPLVEPLSAQHARARKIKPQLAEGKLVKVARARNQAEGEFIQGLLLEEGVPSLLRRSAGFDVPDFLAAGPRDVLVPESGAVTAREVLLEAEVISDASQPGYRASRPQRPLVLFGGLLVALAVGVLVLWLLSLLVR